MKKKLLPLAIAAAMVPGFASAADVSGFADIIYTATDSAADDTNNGGTTNPNIGKFTAAGEVDFSASPADGVTTRVDVDLDLSAASSGNIEQAFFAWGATEGVTVIGGVFNNPIGHDAEDAPDMDFTSHSAVYTAMDSQTALTGNNVAGLAVAGAAGPVTITAALLNDLNQVDEENSFALALNMSPVEGLDLELGYATQAGNGLLGEDNGVSTSVGNWANFNAVYTGVENLTIGFDYLMPDEVLDSAFDVWAGYSFNKFGVKVRYSDVAYNDDDVADLIAAAGGGATGAAAVLAALDAANLPADDFTSTTLYLSYQVASNLSAALEFSNYEIGDGDSEDLTTLELIATF